jgi:hypothetical protein
MISQVSSLRRRDRERATFCPCSCIVGSFSSPWINTWNPSIVLHEREFYWSLLFNTFSYHCIAEEEMSVRQAAVLGDGLGNDYATHLLKVPLTSNGTFLCLVLFFLVLSCLVLSCLVLSCLFLSCPVLSHLIWYCLVSSCLVLPCFVLCVFVLPCFVLCVFLRVTL